MNVFTLVRTIAIAMTTKNNSNKLIWGATALLGLVLFIGEKVRAQDEQYCGIQIGSPHQVTPAPPGVFGNNAANACSGEEWVSAIAGGSDYERSVCTSINGFHTGSCPDGQNLVGSLNDFSFETQTHTLNCRTQQNIGPCASGELVNGVCTVVNNEHDCLCTIDDLPMDLVTDTGYENTCDRPAHQSCPDGSVILATESCPPECDSLSSCTQQACQSESALCEAGTTITSVGYDSQQGSAFSCGSGGNLCELVDSEEPQSQCTDYGTCLAEACSVGCTEGGYVDGFVYGSGSNYANSCSASGNVCGDNPNGNGQPDPDVENPMVDNPDVQTTGTNQTDVAAAVNESAERNTDAINQLNVNMSQNTQTVSQALQQLGESDDANSAAVVASNDRINATNRAGFGEVNDNLEAIKESLDEIAEEGDEIDTSFYGQIQNAPIVLAGSSISNMFTGGGNCPEFAMSIPQPVNATLRTSLHCDIFDTNASILSGVFLAIYAFVGYRVFISA